MEENHLLDDWGTVAISSSGSKWWNYSFRTVLVWSPGCSLSSSGTNLRCSSQQQSHVLVVVVSSLVQRRLTCLRTHCVLVLCSCPTRVLAQKLGLTWFLAVASVPASRRSCTAFLWLRAAATCRAVSPACRHKRSTKTHSVF